MNGYYFQAFHTPIQLQSSSSHIISYPYGCLTSSTQCTFPLRTPLSNISAIAQLQDFVTSSFVTIRLNRMRRNDLTLSVTLSSLQSNEKNDLLSSLGVFLYQNDLQLQCVEDVSFETIQIEQWKNNVLLNLLLKYSYLDAAHVGVFGSILSLNENSYVDVKLSSPFVTKKENRMKLLITGLNESQEVIAAGDLYEDIDILIIGKTVSTSILAECGLVHMPN